MLELCGLLLVPPPVDELLATEELLPPPTLPLTSGPPGEGIPSELAKSGSVAPEAGVEGAWWLWGVFVMASGLVVVPLLDFFEPPLAVPPMLDINGNCCLVRCSARVLAGNSVSQTRRKSLAKCKASSSTREVSRVTLAVFLRPAGKLSPIFSNFSRNFRPPSLLLARRRTPPKREAFKPSGGMRRRCTSPTVTLYFGVELSRLNLPGTEQKVSLGVPLVSLFNRSLACIDLCDEW